MAYLEASEKMKVFRRNAALKDILQYMRGISRILKSVREVTHSSYGPSMTLAMDHPSQQTLMMKAFFLRRNLRWITTITANTIESKTL